MSRTTLRLRVALAVVLPCLFALPASAQDADEEFTPPNEVIDEELDRTLEEEYEGGGPSTPAPPPPQPRVEQVEPPPAPPPPPPPPPSRRSRKDIELTLGGVAAHYTSVLRRIEVSYREGGRGGAELKLDDERLGTIAEPDAEDSQFYRAWLGIGRHIELRGGFWRTVYRDERPAGRTFSYGATTFSQGRVLRTSLDVMTADLDLVLKPLDNSWVTIDLSAGARYAFWRTKFEDRVAGPVVGERSTLEALIPMVGLGLELRPVSALQLHARARVGHFEYERDEETVRRHGELHHVEYKEREQTSVEVDAGFSLILDETIGVTVGYRLDHIEMERTVKSRAETVKGTAHGLYAALLLEF